MGWNQLGFPPYRQVGGHTAVMSGFILAMIIGQVELQPRMGDAISGLDAAYTARFEAGAQLYNTSLIAEDGLGPIFNKQSCANCHNNPVGGHGSQTVIRFGMEDKKEGFIELEEYGGSLLQVSGIDLACAEELPPMANIVADRLTIGMLGYGLVEAIADADLLALESSGPGVSGRANIVPLLEDPTTTRVGRFGWKSQLATILSFSGDAAREEMGLTNRLIPTENDPNGILPPAISECDTVPDPEDGPDAEGFHFIDRVSDFQRFLAAPPQTPRSGMRGEQLFNQVGCAQCHNASFTTANDPSLEPFLRNKTIRPYSNFLLHNMGLASDFIAQAGAGQYEMRTPPLWGLRTRRPMWHDGRISEGTFTDLITDAIAEHDALLSEGVASAQAYDALSAQDKTDVIAFLGSLGRAEFDMNADESVDLFDLPSVTGCFNGDGTDQYDADSPCAIADIDQDGDVDETDASWFAQALGAPFDTADCDGDGVLDIVAIASGSAADVDGDGVPDACSICPGDFDGDGAVTFPDLVRVLSAWGACAACPEDLDGNGVVGFPDLVLILSVWGGC
ncbi:MAG TPA: hypothetical protein DEQ73_04360 [Phycisphaerales bacterium]|nr:hypothetical protein [Phycisphaerales bacterium]